MFSNSTRPGPVSYGFIDGAYLDAFARTAGKEWFGAPAVLDFRKLSSALNSKRTFYYDCLPAVKPNLGAEQNAAARDAKLAHFARLRELPGWHLSEGLAHWRRKDGAGQKEVDILIAVDMLTHTHRRNMEAITFIAGDLDFRPLVEAVVRDGMYLSLWHAPGSHEALLASADETRMVGPVELLQWCEDSFVRSTPVPQKSLRIGAPDGPILERTAMSGPDAALLHGPSAGDNTYKIAGPGYPDGGRVMVYRGNNVVQLKCWHAAYHGPNEWIKHE